MVKESNTGPYLTELRHDLPQQTVQDRELAAEVDVALERPAVTHTLQIRDLVQELLHGAPLHLQKLIHEAQIVLLPTEPAEDTHTAVWERETDREREREREREERERERERRTERERDRSTEERE